MQPYTADMARLAAGRMARKAEICEGNARTYRKHHFEDHWADLALE
mgnify:FL=1